MARFQYSMQKVLDVKEKLETQAKTAFSVAQMNVNQARDRLDELTARRDHYEEMKRQCMEGVLDVKRLNSCQTAIEIMDYYINQQKRTIAALEAVLDKARRQLNQAMMERKMHDKLKEREFEQFLLDLNAQEKKEIDELVSYTYNNRESEG